MIFNRNTFIKPFCNYGTYADTWPLPHQQLSTWISRLLPPSFPGPGLREAKSSQKMEVGGVRGRRGWEAGNPGRVAGWGGGWGGAWTRRCVNGVFMGHTVVLVERQGEEIGRWPHAGQTSVTAQRQATAGNRGFHSTQKGALTKGAVTEGGWSRRRP